MPKKKKTILTEEERKLRNESKNQKEEELRKKKLEEAKKIMEEKLQEEERISKLNRLALHEKWRQIMRELKAENLRKDVDILAQTQERVVDRKDAIIHRLEVTLHEIEEQHQMAVSSHFQNVQNLTELYQSRAQALEEEFQFELEDMEKDYATERQSMIEKHAGEKEELQDILIAMDQEFSAADAETKLQFQNLRDELQSKSLEDLSNLNAKLQGRIRQLEKAFDQELNNYNNQTEGRVGKLHQKTNQDEQNTKTIQFNNRKLMRLQKSLAHWRTKINNNSKECDQRNKSLKEEKDAVASHFQALKGKMTKMNERENAKLSELASNCNNCIKVLTKKMKKAEKILVLAEMNEKLETEKEKVNPFYQNTEFSEEEKEEFLEEVLQEQESLEQQPNEDFQELLNSYSSTMLSKNNKTVGKWNYLENFFKKFNKAYLDKIALENEKKRLLEENQNLQTILKEYLNGISVNSEVLGKPNTLFMVNGKIATAIKVAEKIEPEQALVLATSNTASRRIKT